MAVLHSKFDRFFERNPVSGALVNFQERKTETTFAPSGGERILGSFDLAPLTGLSFFAEFTVTTLPADGSGFGLFNGGSAAAGTDPERTLYVSRSGDFYNLKIILGQGNSGNAANFPIPLTVGFHRIAIRFGSAGANAGVAFSGDQAAWLGSSRMSYDGGAEVLPVNLGFFQSANAADDGVIDRIVFNQGLYSQTLPGTVHASGWGHVGANGLVAADIVDFSTNGAWDGVPVAPDAPTGPDAANITHNAAAISCVAPTTGGQVESYEIELGLAGGTLAVIANPDTTYDLTLLAGASEYQHRWRAIGIEGIQGAWSAIDYFWTDNLITGGGSLASQFVLSVVGTTLTVRDEANALVVGAAVVATPGNIALGNTNASGQVSLSSLVPGNYTLTATTGGGAGSLTYRVEGGPVITSPATFSIVENSTAIATLVANDPNSDSIVWAIAGGADAARFSIGATSGTLAFVLEPDFESPADADQNNIYLVTVSATANGQAATQAITVTVTNGPEIITEVHLVEPQSGLIRGRPGIPVRVRCLDQLARPAEGVTISAQPGAVYVPGNPSIYIGVTDSQGYCVWENPPLGQFIGIAFFDNGL